MTYRQYLENCTDEFEKTIIIANLARRCPNYDSYSPNRNYINLVPYFVHFRYLICYNGYRNKEIHFPVSATVCRFSVKIYI